MVWNKMIPTEVKKIQKKNASVESGSEVATIIAKNIITNR